MAITLPNLTVGTYVDGAGFTCTGICRASAGGWWVANFGKEQLGSADSPHSSLVRLNETFTTVAQEIDLAAWTGSSIQGLALRTTDNSLFVSINGTSARRYSEAGTLQTGFITPVTNVNGLCYDAENDMFYTLSGTGVLHSYDGATYANIATLATCPGAGADHITMVNGKVWCSAGLNGQTGKIYEYTPGTDSWEHIYNLTEADAIEGIAVHNGKLYVANDGYYHAPDGSDPALNRILVYPLPATGGTMTATTLSVGTLTI